MYECDVCDHLWVRWKEDRVKYIYTTKYDLYNPDSFRGRRCRRPSSHHSIHRIQKTCCSGTQVLLRLNTASTLYTGLSAVNGQPQFPPFTNCSAGTRKDPLELGPQVFPKGCTRPPKVRTVPNLSFCPLSQYSTLYWRTIL